ncbi:hypothetical protein SCP_0607910 [Sparassis crispa]|uniref:Uncharacterized protein n=1 Tax=Sparassis crispa TaxID=139825 RepID=A0A401GRD7_9APHY|nr:hypothetical protein SCP_0607910 [Sparassis crispa]GBE84811.1 hypothetical protein SCP_0607910 [Sparassis crispa]
MTAGEGLIFVSISVQNWEIFLASSQNVPFKLPTGKKDAISMRTTRSGTLDDFNSNPRVPTEM